MSDLMLKLLFDENISYRIVRKLAHLYLGSEQVKRLGLLSRKDGLIWDYAKRNNFVIVTHDEDYDELSALRGTPPKVIWLRTGNIITDELANLLITHFDKIKDFIQSKEEQGCLELYR
ncbi:DUF5615 family PIN-like protein [Spirosoma aerolatum]|uniref:DUF5615 family PIN-like protein n=1 Tax=Spirosoma aerolatum TaxID=1211326 RepID=UPI0009AD502B|nr:DUF5615 family PIN-like protein [Spirosoma aerolatum]